MHSGTKTGRGVAGPTGRFAPSSLHVRHAVQSGLGFRTSGVRLPELRTSHPRERRCIALTPMQPAATVRPPMNPAQPMQISICVAMLTYGAGGEVRPVGCSPTT